MFTDKDFWKVYSDIEKKDNWELFFYPFLTTILILSLIFIIVFKII